MAVQRTLQNARFQLRLQTGIIDGKPIVMTRSYNMKGEAEDLDIHTVAQLMAGLQENTLIGVRRVETNSLDETEG